MLHRLSMGTLALVRSNYEDRTPIAVKVRLRVRGAVSHVRVWSL
jgi:hypothetical protein